MAFGALLLSSLLPSGCTPQPRREEQGAAVRNENPAPGPTAPATPRLLSPIRYTDHLGPAGELRLGGSATDPRPSSDELAVSAESRPDGGLLLSASFLSETAGASSTPLREGLLLLGFQDQGKGRPAALYQRSLSPDRRRALREQVAQLRLAALERLWSVRPQPAAATEPGLRCPAQPLMPQRWGGGTLLYTGHGMDVAMPDAGREGTLFLPLRLLAPVKELNLQAGQLAWIRGGRLYVDEAGRLRTHLGLLAATLKPVPPAAALLAVWPDGRVVAALGSGEELVLGQLHLARCPAARGNGMVFLPPEGTEGLEGSLNPGEGSLGGLRTGHLELPEPLPARQDEEAGAQARLVRLLEQLELALREPASEGAKPPIVPLKEPDQIKQLVIAAEIPNALDQLTKLGISVESTPGRVTLKVGGRAADRQAMVAALSKVLEGLRTRLAIHQTNHNNANLVRDDQGKLNPYRRRVVKVGQEGEVLVEEDKSPFREVERPADPDAGPDGKVRYPNVDRQVEAALFLGVTQEYRLLRSALERLAPDLIFPDPPTLAPAPKTP